MGVGPPSASFGNDRYEDGRGEKERGAKADGLTGDYFRRNHNGDKERDEQCHLDRIVGQRHPRFSVQVEHTSGRLCGRIDRRFRFASDTRHLVSPSAVVLFRTVVPSVALRCR